MLPSSDSLNAGVDSNKVAVVKNTLGSARLSLPNTSFRLPINLE